MGQIHLLSIIFIAVFLIQAHFYFRYFLPFTNSAHPPIEGPINTAPVSVIICAHNELQNLKENLPSFLDQEYENYELIVVNDRSTDGSQDWLADQQSHFSHLKVLHIKHTPENFNPKKYALTQGIEKANHEIVLLSDADCQTASQHWIDKMAQSFGPSTQIVLGASLYKKRKGLLNQFIRFETLQTALLYLSFAYKKKAYMGVGRNLGYKKSYFKATRGFQGIQDIQGGDDDLWINKHSTAENTAVCVHPASITFSKPKESWTSFFTQKKRHLSVGKYYKTKDKIKLGFYHLSQVLVWILIILVSILGNQTYCLILYSFSLIHIIGQYVVYYKLSIKFGIEFTHNYSPLLEILFTGYYWVWGAYASLTKHLKWK